MTLFTQAKHKQAAPAYRRIFFAMAAVAVAATSLFGGMTAYAESGTAASSNENAVNITPPPASLNL